MSNKLCVTVQGSGEGLDVPLDGRFGRAERFLIVDRETSEIVEVVDNTAANAAHGAGTAAAALMRSHDVNAVISGRYGPKAHQALSAMGIETWVASPSVTARRAIEQLSKGELEQMEMKVFR